MACCSARPSGGGRRPPAVVAAVPHVGVDDERLAAAVQADASVSHGQPRAKPEQAIASEAEGMRPPLQLSRLDADVGAWLEAQGEALAVPSRGAPNGRALADVLRTDLKVSTLRELMSVIQHPADWARVVPGDPERCRRLWLSLLRESEAAKQAAAMAQEEDTSTATMPDSRAEEPPAWFETLR